MSRNEDLTFAEEQLQTLRAEAVQLQEAFQKYDIDVTQNVREILTKAGIWEGVNKLEVERHAARQRMQERLKMLTEQAEDLQKVRSFLLGRDQMAKVAEVAQPMESLPVRASKATGSSDSVVEVVPDFEGVSKDSGESGDSGGGSRPRPTPPL